MIFHWPQITLITLMAMRFGAAVVRHGKPRTLTSAWAQLIDTAFVVWVLFAGGFFGVVA